MIVSTRGRYALRVLLDLAAHTDEGFVPMQELARRQGISKKYLEQIMPALTRGGLVEAQQGKRGGYRLSCAPQSCTVGQVLRLTEGDLAPVACLSREAAPCDRSPQCRTLAMWQRFYDMTNDYFDSITLSELLQ